MVHYTDIYALKAKLYKLKFELNQENLYHYDDPKRLANKYLDKAIDYVDELQLY